MNLDRIGRILVLSGLILIYLTGWVAVINTAVKGNWCMALCIGSFLLILGGIGCFIGKSLNDTARR